VGPGVRRNDAGNAILTMFLIPETKT
jgi:hypothetical protein